MYLVYKARAEEPGDRNWSGDHRLNLLTGLFPLAFSDTSLKTNISQAHLPRNGTTCSGPGPPTSVTEKEYPPRHACWPVELRQFQGWDFLLPSHYWLLSRWQKLTSTLIFQHRVKNIHLENKTTFSINSV